MSTFQKNRLTITLTCITLSIIIGTAIGVNYSTFMDLVTTKPVPKSKLTLIINYIDNEYVDTINRNQLVEYAISDLVSKLDPHSEYTSIPNKFDNIKTAPSFEISGVNIYLADNQ